MRVSRNSRLTGAVAGVLCAFTPVRPAQAATLRKLYPSRAAYETRVMVIPDGPSTSNAAAEVVAFERQMEAAVVRGDVAFLDRICAPDFSFTHGDGWTTGGAPLRVENKAQWLAAVGKSPYEIRDLDSVKVELHGDIAITYGRYRARFKAGAPGRREFTVWFERVYARRDGRWQYLSHRTVNGPDYQQ